MNNENKLLILCKELEEIIDTINELAISNYKNKNMHTKMMRELVLSMHKINDIIKQIER